MIRFGPHRNDPGSRSVPLYKVNNAKFGEWVISPGFDLEFRKANYNFDLVSAVYMEAYSDEYIFKFDYPGTLQGIFTLNYIPTYPKFLIIDSTIFFTSDVWNRPLYALCEVEGTPTYVPINYEPFSFGMKKPGYISHPFYPNIDIIKCGPPGIGPWYVRVMPFVLNNHGRKVDKMSITEEWDVNCTIEFERKTATKQYYGPKYLSTYDFAAIKGNSSTLPFIYGDDVPSSLSAAYFESVGLYFDPENIAKKDKIYIPFEEICGKVFKVDINPFHIAELSRWYIFNGIDFGYIPDMDLYVYKIVDNPIIIGSNLYNGETNENVLLDRRVNIVWFGNIRWAQDHINKNLKIESAQRTGGAVWT